MVEHEAADVFRLCELVGVETCPVDELLHGEADAMFVFMTWAVLQQCIVVALRHEVKGLPRAEHHVMLIDVADVILDDSDCLPHLVFSDSQFLWVSFLSSIGKPLPSQLRFGAL
jgi:hypothetical protein